MFARVLSLLQGLGGHLGQEELPQGLGVPGGAGNPSWGRGGDVVGSVGRVSAHGPPLLSLL